MLYYIEACSLCSPYFVTLAALLAHTEQIALVSRANFSRTEVGGMMGGGKNTYGDYI